MSYCIYQQECKRYLMPYTCVFLNTRIQVVLPEFPKNKCRNKNGSSERFPNMQLTACWKKTNCAETTLMELRGKLAWLVLSACAATVQSLGVEGSSTGVVDIQTLTTGMQVLQTVSVSGQRQQATHMSLACMHKPQPRSLSYAPPPFVFCR